MTTKDEFKEYLEQAQQKVGKTDSEIAFGMVDGFFEALVRNSMSGKEPADLDAQKFMISILIDDAATFDDFIKKNPPEMLTAQNWEHPLDIGGDAKRTIAEVAFMLGCLAGKTEALKKLSATYSISTNMRVGLEESEEQDCDTNVKNMSILHFCSISGVVNSVRALLELGADIDIKARSFDPADNKLYTPIDMLEDAREEIKHDSPEMESSYNEIISLLKEEKQRRTDLAEKQMQEKEAAQQARHDRNIAKIDQLLGNRKAAATPRPRL